MIHALEWIHAWRLKQAYSLTEADILSLVQSLGEQAHISLHPAWGMMEECFLKPQIEAMPEYLRSTLLDCAGIVDDIVVNSPSWIVRAFNERDKLYNSLRSVATHANDREFNRAVTVLFNSVYEGEPPPVSAETFCASFLMPNDEHLFYLIFHESLLFNRYAAVEALEKAHYPFAVEVKGITENFVETVRLQIQQPVSVPAASHPTGSNKDVARIQATRQACEAVRAKIAQGHHGFQVRGEYKTNQNYFQQAVQAILGDVKAHRSAVRKEWGKVPGGLKHLGRVPEQ